MIFLKCLFKDRVLSSVLACHCELTKLHRFRLSNFCKCSVASELLREEMVWDHNQMLVLRFGLACTWCGIVESDSIDLFSLRDNFYCRYR